MKVVVLRIWPRCFVLRWMKNCGDTIYFLLSPPKLVLIWNAVWCKPINGRLVPKMWCSGAKIEPSVTTSTTVLQGAQDRQTWPCFVKTSTQRFSSAALWLQMWSFLLHRGHSHRILSFSTHYCSKGLASGLDSSARSGHLWASLQ